MELHTLSHHKLERLLLNVKSSDEAPVLTSEDAAAILSDFTKPMLCEYRSWFTSARCLAEWLTLLYKHNPEHCNFPSIESIASYRSFLCKSLQRLSSRELVELMEFFNPDEANYHARNRKHYSILDGKHCKK